MLKYIIEPIPLENIDGYMCSTFGEIFSIKNGTLNKISLQTDIDGYHSVTLLDNDGKLKKFQVHRLIAFTFLDNPFNYPCVNHKNGIRNNNNLLNLEYCSHSYNNLHSFITFSKNQKGENNNCSVLSNIQAKEIYNLVHSGISPKSLALQYNVSISTIRSIKNGLRYNSVTKHKPEIIMRYVYNDEHSFILKSKFIGIIG